MDKKRRSRSSSPPKPAGKRALGDAPIGRRGASSHRKGVNPASRDAVASPDPSTPTPDMSPEDRAAALMAKLDEFEALIPNFQHHDPNDIRRVTAIARFAPDLVVPTIATTTSFPPAAERNLFDTEGNQLHLRAYDSFGPIVQRLSALAAGVQFTRNNGMAEAGAQALDVYNWAKSYSKRPDAAALRPYVAMMSRVVKKVLNHRKRKASSKAPAPSPSPAPSQLPPGAHGFLASNVVPSKPAGEDVFPDHFNEALDRATKE
jgi:hypothetical protein